MTIKHALKSLAASIQPIPANEGQRLAILNYHSVGGGAAASIETNLFDAQLELISQRYHSIDLNDPLNNNVEKIKTLLTFDDGYLDNFEFAAPLLKAYSQSAVFFITTDFIEKEIDITINFRSYRGLKPMTWDQVGRLHELGHTIGLHGQTHRAFSVMSVAEAWDEMENSFELLKRRTGIIARAFAYPFGQLDHRRPDMVAIASSLGIQHVFSTENRGVDMSAIQESNSTHPLPRLRVDASDSPLIVRDKIDGRWDYISGIQRILSCIRLRSMRAYGALY